jgi:hypothetical protein
VQRYAALRRLPRPLLARDEDFFPELRFPLWECEPADRLERLDFLARPERLLPLDRLEVLDRLLREERLAPLDWLERLRAEAVRLPPRLWLRDPRPFDPVLDWRLADPRLSLSSSSVSRLTSLLKLLFCPRAVLS